MKRTLSLCGVITLLLHVTEVIKGDETTAQVELDDGIRDLDQQQFAQLITKKEEALRKENIKLLRAALLKYITSPREEVGREKTTRFRAITGPIETSTNIPLGFTIRGIEYDSTGKVRSFKSGTDAIINPMNSSDDADIDAGKERLADIILKEEGDEQLVEDRQSQQSRKPGSVEAEPMGRRTFSKFMTKLMSKSGIVGSKRSGDVIGEKIGPQSMTDKKDTGSPAEENEMIEKIKNRMIKTAHIDLDDKNGKQTEQISERIIPLSNRCGNEKEDTNDPRYTIITSKCTDSREIAANTRENHANRERTTESQIDSVNTLNVVEKEESTTNNSENPSESENGRVNETESTGASRDETPESKNPPVNTGKTPKRRGKGNNKPQIKNGKIPKRRGRGEGCSSHPVSSSPTEEVERPSSVDGEGTVTTHTGKRLQRNWPYPNTFTPHGIHPPYQWYPSLHNGFLNHWHCGTPSGLQNQWPVGAHYGYLIFQPFSIPDEHRI